MTMLEDRRAALERENAELRRQLDICHAELKEARAQQTATAEVLQVINSSPGDLTPVFQAIVDRAHTLCDAAYGSLQLWDGEKFRAVAVNGFSEVMAEALRQGYIPGSNHPCRRLLEGERAAHCIDLAEVDDPVTREGGVKVGGIRTVLYVALRRDAVLLGQIVAARQEVRPFSAKEIALVENFAAQAVIAMENARLLTETREALEQQTATAEVLQVINSSPGDLAPVFDAILEKAHSLCDSGHGTLFLRDGDYFRPAAMRGVPEPIAKRLRGGVLGTEVLVSRPLLVGARFVHIEDTAHGDHPMIRLARENGVRALLSVPLKKGDEVLGMIVAARFEAPPFSEKQIALLENFAAQAVIAMENARLLTETREALEQQTATAEVLEVINSSPGDLAPVFDAMLVKALRLCEASFGVLSRIDGNNFSGIAVHGAPSELADALRQPRQIMPGNAHYRLVHGEDVVQVEDITAEDIYRSGNPARRALADVGGARTALWVALRKENAALGAFVVYRNEVRPFSDNQIALLQNFAAQAVIAMENARLLTETREALEQQTATAEVLQVVNSSPGDLAPVFDAILEKAHSFCGAVHGSLHTADADGFRGVAMRGVPKAFADLIRHPFQPGPNHPVRELIDGAPFTTVINSPEFDDPIIQRASKFAGMRTALFVPLRKDRALRGYIVAARPEIRPFSDKQIALLQNFAAQAVIAMENARLLTETREALEQQTATAEVLQVINSSPGDLPPVFDAILQKAHAICGAAYGGLMTFDGEAFRVVAAHGEPQFLEYWQQGPIRPPEDTPLWRVMHGEPIAHITDAVSEDSYRNAPQYARLIDLGGVRTFVIVPLRKDDTLRGVITAYRQEVRPFTEKEIALLQNFAAQAIIAMENARLLTETREALEQQTATAEVLQVINSSPGDLAPVFDAMLEKATSLCEAAFGTLVTYDGERFAPVAGYGVAPAFAAFRVQRGAFLPPPGSSLERVANGEVLVHIADVAEDPDQAATPLVKLGGCRALICVGLRKDDSLIGAITAYRQEARPFSEKQIALLQNFAAQAVIAMENARLITETREALEQQTATAEVLQVINYSPGNLAPVFDAMLEKAMRLCDAAFGSFATFDGEFFHAAAHRNVPAELAEALREPMPLTPGGHLMQIASGEAVVPVADFSDTDAYLLGKRWAVALVEKGGARTAVWVALRKDEKLLGILVLHRKEVRPFTDKQIALLQNFAAQAVIAMENARLLTETREALEQQTATAEVLQVINASPGDLAPVFNAILEKAHALCEASFGALMTYDGERFQPVALQGVATRFWEFIGQGIRPKSGDPFGLMVEGAPLSHIHDLSKVAAQYPKDPLPRAAVDLGGIRTFLIVPLRKESALLGAITAYRQEVRPFTDKQISLLQNFAAQAVIAIENARLLTETREALEQQTATAEVLQVINSSPGDLAPVFDAMLEKAMRLCDAAFGGLWTFNQESYVAEAVRGVPRPYAEFLAGATMVPGPGTAPYRFLQGERLVHNVDLASEEPYRAGDPQRRALVDLGGARTALQVPLRKDKAVLGVITIYRQEVRPFSDKQIALLQNFAAQAVIAMENARLLRELQQRTDDLQESLEFQTAISDVLRVISGSVFDLEPVLQTVVSTAIRLCRADQAVIYRNVDGEYYWAAGDSLAPEYERIERDVRIRPGPGTLVGRAALEARTVQILDALTDPFYEAKDDARIGGVHTMIGVPLLREGVPIGVIGLARQRVEVFSEREIQLVTTFADQAVIAIENARLLGELRERTDDLQESLEYQTATSDVLKVISQSTFDLRPVLETLAGTASRLCEAEMAFIFRREGELYRVAASVGFSPETKALVEANPISPGRGTTAGRTALTANVVHIPDARSDPEYTFGEFIRVAKTPTMLGVPLLREGVPVGVIVLARQRVEPFSDKQIELVRTFADQAVIAIENARLFNELRARTEELGRSVEELKMLGEVGRAVSSTLDLRAVSSKILSASLGVTWANAGAIFRYIRAERAFRLVEAVGWDEALQNSVGDLRVAEAETAMGEAAARRTPVQIVDLAARPSAPLRDSSLAAGFHSALIVPLVGAERTLGAIVLMRREAGEFPPETVRLLQTLASQSVLAIQNARLFREIADKSEQLALASQHKSQFLANMSHELRTPLNAILGYAELLVDGIYGVLPEKAQGVLERVQNNGQHLLALINDVLDLAKIEAGQLTLTIEDYALPEVVRSVVTATEPLATAKGLRFTTDVQDNMPMAHGDARRVSQVLLNLVGNAIKFTDQGEVGITASLANGQFALEVRDTGPGIADADQERIFGEFQQIDNSSTRKKGGTGLGLAISKRMVEIQGGMISVESALGQGSTFRVVLPVHVEPTLEEAA